MYLDRLHQTTHPEGQTKYNIVYCPTQFRLNLHCGTSGHTKQVSDPIANLTNIIDPNTMEG